MRWARLVLKMPLTGNMNGVPFAASPFLGLTLIVEFLNL
jgi:hypothetical protein